MILKISAIFSFSLLIHASLHGQIGGRHVYDFLNLTTGPSITAVGGINVSTVGDDLHMAYQNPALLTDSMDNHLVLSYTDYLADIGFGYAGYSKSFEGLANFHTGVQFVDYGQFEEADEFGNRLGTFSAGEWAWALGASRSIGPFQYGAQVKVIYSRLAPGFQSVGLLGDFGGAYFGKNGLFSAGLTIRNVGAQLSGYADTGIREPVPTQVILGFSNKLKYMPLRFSVTAIHLEQPKLYVEDPNRPVERDLNGNLIDNSPSTVDRVFRHLVFGGEFLLGQALRLRLGYNHQRRQELRSINRGGTTGFTFGAGLRLKRLLIDYGFGSYGLNGLFHTHQFGIGMNFTKPKSS